MPERRAWGREVTNSNSGLEEFHIDEGGRGDGNVA
jgi:hypothetical protein